jgi:hypothetical protein
MMRAEVIDILEDAALLGRRRNDVTHGIAVAWKSGDLAVTTSLREIEG